MQTVYAAAGPGQETSGISIQCSFGSKACSTIFRRAVAQDGVVLDILVQPRRDGGAAKRFFRRLINGLQDVPRVIVTDKLRSYSVAQREPPSQGRTSTKQIFEQSG